MKTAFATATVVLLAMTFAFTANSDEPVEEKTALSFNTSDIGKELLDTLADSYELRFQEYRSGRSGPARLLDINRELYEQQRESVAADQRLIVAEQFLARAKEINAIAEIHLKHGTGTRMDLLDTRASQLRATIELENVAAL
ncbi:hypothetical protein [Rhodopirellula europaea]|uniref:hypothetical protein n=1 Tax=Rhodopirellula europaea TaxID=1263866 RepID=UPI003D2DF1E9|tara:strand:- start:2532 stop:2957 length:426 start_codon:yes stop_codon:yes gene_type:complete